MNVINDMRKGPKRSDADKANKNAALIGTHEHSVAVNDSYINEPPLVRTSKKPTATGWLVVLSVIVVMSALTWGFGSGSGSVSVKADADLLAALSKALVTEQLGVDVSGSAGSSDGNYQPIVPVGDNSQRRRPVNQVVELKGSAGIAVLATQVSAAPQPVSVKVNIKQLLDEADRALVRDHLTTPLDNNAYSRYQTVLAHDPANQRALVGVEKIQQRYLGFVAKKLQAGAFTELPPLVQKARDVGATEAQFEALLAQTENVEQRQKLQAVMQATAREVKVTADAGAITGAERSTSGGRAFASNNKSQLALVGGRSSASQLPPGTGAETAFQQRDRQQALRAQQWLASGQVEVALAHLTAFVNEYPAARFSLVQLFNIYLQQQRLDDARNLINRASHLPGYQFSYLVAEILIRRQDMPGALRALESQRPPLQDVPAYYALQAALLYQQGDYQQSATLYQQLLTVEPAESSYWFGLAINLDSLGQADEALAAFAQVDRLADADSQYGVYARQRLAGLPLSEDYSCCGC